MGASRRVGNTKRLHWTAVKNVDQETVWNANEEHDATMDLEELSTMFARNRPAAAKPAESDAPAAASKAPKRVTLIKMKRANNIAITLSRFKMTNEQLRAIILGVQLDKLDADGWEALIRCVPEDEELEVLGCYEGDLAVLGRTEQFFLSIADIPRVVLRLETIGKMLAHDDLLRDLQTKLGMVGETSRCVKNSKRFPRLLKLVLDIGNYLNQGTTFGRAKAFRLEALLKLADTKSVDLKQTLLDYLVALVAESSPELLDIDGDFPQLEKVTQASIEGFVSDLLQLQSGVAMIEHEVDLARKRTKTIDGDGMLSVMEPFLERAKAAMEELNALYATVEKQTREMVTFYGEDLQECPPDQFFKLLYTFMLQFRDAKKKHEALKAREARDAARAKRAEEVALAKAKT